MRGGGQNFYRFFRQQSQVGQLPSPSRRVEQSAQRALDADPRSTHARPSICFRLPTKPAGQVIVMRQRHRTNSARNTKSGGQRIASAGRSAGAAVLAIVKFVMAVLLAVFLFSGFFTVGPQEKAIILRLGRPVGEGDKALLGAGPHWAWPYPIDEVVKVPITEIQKITSTVGWYAHRRRSGTGWPAPNRRRRPSLNPGL